MKGFLILTMAYGGGGGLKGSESKIWLTAYVICERRSPLYTNKISTACKVSTLKIGHVTVYDTLPVPTFPINVTLLYYLQVTLYPL